MNFNSPQYLLFVPLLLILYAAIFRRERGRDLLLLTASYAFYMAWNWKYAGLIAFSTLVDYAIGRAMARSEAPGRRKALLVASLTVNLGLLAVFKYYNFFIDLGQGALTPLGLNLSSLHHELLLPVGISFYTFQTLSYTIDLYRRQIEPERSLTKFALFVSFFPQLVAGPIVRASDFLPQLQRTPDVRAERISSGMRRIFRGLFKKVVLADLLAGLGVDAAFRDPSAFSSLELLLALYGYAYQIYNDFSGYSDIAIGTAALLGFDIPENFKRPYLSQNVREFWTRWHISLSSWLRDYLYIALGGNRTRVRTNLMLTMLLGGLWHGAALNFVFWGAYHGVLLVFARKTDKHAPAPSAGIRAWRRFACFHLVLGGWLLFRVTGMDNLKAYVSGLARLTLSTEDGFAFHPLYVVVLVLAAVIHMSPPDWFERLGVRFARAPLALQGAAYAGAILLFGGLSMQAPAFIYFQF